MDRVRLIHNENSTEVKAANKRTLQKAIDYAFNSGIKEVPLVDGTFYCDPEIYLDAPNNLRLNLTNPTQISFSLKLKGAGSGVDTGYGTELRFTDNSKPALIVGTGQNMGVAEISILGPNGASSRAALPANGVGIALAGGGGGLSRALIDDVTVSNFRHGILSGFNADQLCDSVTVRKSTISNCYRGWNILRTQNYINEALGCTFQDNTWGIYSPVGKPVNVIGGNHSATSANKNAFSISNTSPLTAFVDASEPFLGGQFGNWSFTTQIDVDDQPMRDGAYDAFVIKTNSFGLVPLTLLNYDLSTKTATFKFYFGWLTWNWQVSPYPLNDIKARTDIETELAAATTLYACETITTFMGTGINASGVHIENPGALTRLLNTEAGFNGDRISRLDKIMCNYNINQIEQSWGSEQQKAVFYCQQTFPFITARQADISISDGRFSSDPSLVGVGKDSVHIEVVASQFKSLTVRNTDIIAPNVSFPMENSGGWSWQSRFHGAGEWDYNPFVPATGSIFYHRVGLNGGVPFMGWRPASYTTPRLLPAQLAAIQQTPMPAVGTYPPLSGETIYSILDENSTAPLDIVLARSDHQFYSYGQNLNISWTYKGWSNVLYVSSTALLFSGLKIILNNGEGDVGYLITGVYPTLGYVTVSRLPGSAEMLAGDKSTTYTGSVIKQEPYAITAV